MSNRVGQQLGNYRLLRLLGRGGFAEVYLGEHIHLETQVAVKLLLAHVAPEDIAPFRQEARMISRLTDPHIVRVRDFGVQENTPYLVLDYAPGGTLRQSHPRGTQLSLSTVISYVKQVAQALQHAHDHKLIHRDVKPQNMLVGQNEEVLLSDFGIALVAESSRHRRFQDLAGTLAYMAPEQLKGKPQFASDQYALGIVVYEWLCGTHPFHGTEPEMIAQHGNASPPSLLASLPDLPPAVEEVVMIALAKKPQDRFRSMRAFATALERASLDIPSLSPLVSEPLPSDSLEVSPVKPPSAGSSILNAPVSEVLPVEQPPAASSSLASLNFPEVSPARPPSAMSSILNSPVSEVLPGQQLPAASSRLASPVSLEVPPIKQPSAGSSILNSPVSEALPVEQPPAMSSRLAAPAMLPNTSSAPEAHSTSLISTVPPPPISKALVPVQQAVGHRSPNISALPTAPLPGNGGVYRASLTEEAQQLIARNHLGTPRDVYGPNIALSIIQGLFLTAGGIYLAVVSVNIIVDSTSHFTSSGPSANLASQVPSILIPCMLILLGCWAIVLGLRKIFLAIADRNICVIVCTHGVAFIKSSGSDIFYWTDVAGNFKRHLTLFPHINEKDLFSFLMYLSGIQRKCIVHCHDGRRFVFTDPLGRIADLADVIDTQFMRIKEVSMQENTIDVP
jgi:serine/threonine protein kinase